MAKIAPKSNHHGRNLNVKGGKSSSGERGQKVHGANQSAIMILSITVLFGELPMTQISRLPSAAPYGKSPQIAQN